MSFAKVFGVAQTTVASWEGGKREPGFNTMIKLADFFHVSVDYLLGHDGSQPTIWTNEPISILFSMYSITVKKFSELSGLSYDLADRLSTVTTPLSGKDGKNPLYNSISAEQYQRINDFFHVDLTAQNAKGQCELPLFPVREVVDKLRGPEEPALTLEEQADLYAAMAREQFLKDKEEGISSIFCERIRRGIAPWNWD